MASAAAIKTNVNEDRPAPAQTSVPSLCLTASLKHNKADALNQKVSGEWVHTS